MYFKPSRKTGYSDRMIVYDLVKDAKPEDIFRYKDLEDALSRGIEGPIEKPRIYQAVGQANKTLLKEKQRYLSVVRKEGYRVIRANESVVVAKRKKESAEGLMRRGYEILTNVRRDELTPSELSLHEGTVLAMTGLIMAMKQSDARHARTDSLIENLMNRLDKIEGK